MFTLSFAFFHVNQYLFFWITVERSLGKRRTHATIPQLDGFNIWRSISEGAPSPRKEILHNIIDQKAAIRVGDMKLILNQADRERYIPPELVKSIPAEQGKKVIVHPSCLYLVDFSIVACLCFLVNWAEWDKNQALISLHSSSINIIGAMHVHYTKWSPWRQ